MVCEKEIVNEKKKKPVEHFLPLWSRDSVSASLSLSLSTLSFFYKFSFVCLLTSKESFVMLFLPTLFAYPSKLALADYYAVYIYIYINICIRYVV